MERALRLLVFALCSGLSASLAFGLLFFGGHAISRDFTDAPWLALLLLLPVSILGWLGVVARRLLGPRGPAAAALAVGLVSPLIFLGCLHELREPLIRGVLVPCGNPRAALELLVVQAMFVAGLLGGVLAAPIAARAGEGLHRAAVVLFALSSLLAGASIRRAARFPDADRLRSSLPVVVTVRAASGTPTLVDRPPHPRPTPWERGPLEVYDEAIGDQILRRACSEHRCQVTLVPRYMPADETVPTRWDVDDNALVEVRADPPHDLWVVNGLAWTLDGKDDTPRDPPGKGCMTAEEARAGMSGIPRFFPGDLLVRDVASTHSAPRGWIAGACLGLAFTALLLGIRRRRALARAALAAGREGTLDPSGLVTFLDGEPPIRVAPGQALAVGPVVILGGDAAAGGLYRGDALARRARVACGARADLLAAVEARMALLDALALAAVALTAAPLVAAAVVRLVF